MMDIENVVCTHIDNGIYFRHLQVQNSVFCSNMAETGGHYVKLNEPNTERQIAHDHTYIWKLNN